MDEIKFAHYVNNACDSAKSAIGTCIFSFPEMSIDEVRLAQSEVNRRGFKHVLITNSLKIRLK